MSLSDKQSLAVKLCACFLKELFWKREGSCIYWYSSDFFFFLSSTELYQIRWARQCVNTDVGIVNNCELVHCFCIMSMLWEGLCPFITDMNILWLAKCKLCPQMSVCCFGCACECMWGAGLWSSLLRWKQCSSSRASRTEGWGWISVR